MAFCNECDQNWTHVLWLVEGVGNEIMIVIDAPFKGSDLIYEEGDVFLFVW